MTGQFRLLVLARTISWFGSAVTLVALPIAVYQRTGDAGHTAALTAVESTPYLLLGLLAGAVADRWPRRPTMVVTGLVGAVAIGSVPLAQALGVLSTSQLYVAAFVAGSAMVFFDAAGFGLLPALVPREQLGHAVGRATGVATLITMAGPAAGGVLVAVLSAPYALLLDAASFVLAAALIALIREPAREPVRSQLRREIAEGLRFVWEHRLVRLLTLLGTGNSLAAGMVTGLLVATAVQRYGLAVDDRMIGVLYAGLGVGTLLATLALPRLTAASTAGIVALLGLGVQAVALTVWAAGRAPLLGLAALVVWQAAASTVILNGITLRHQVTPDALQGRVNTTARMLAWGGQPVGAAVAGGLVTVFGLVPTLVVAVGVLGGTWVAAFCSPLRAVSREACG